MVAQVCQLLLDELRRGRRDQHLAAKTHGCNAGGSVDISADVALVSEQRRARVQADPHLDRPRRQRLGHRLRGRNRPRRRGEGEEECVALRVHLNAALGGAGPADQLPVLGERVCIGLVHLVHEAASSSPRRP